MDKNNDRPNNLVLVDYKITTIKRPAEAKSAALVHGDKVALAVAHGNGRIRKVLMLGVVAIAGSIAFGMFSSDEITESHAKHTVLPENAVIEKTPVETASQIATDTQTSAATPNFIFNSGSEAQITELPQAGDVPLVEVESIEDAMPASTPENTTQDENPAPLVAALPELANDYTQEPSQILVEIVKGDTLSGILARQGLSQQEIAAIISLPDVEKTFVNIRPGQEIEVSLDATRRVTKIKRVIDLERTFHIERQPDNVFTAQLDVNPLQKNLQMASVDLQSSLFLDGAEANLSEAMIMELHSIFQWTVDFKRDVRSGDQLALLYEAYYKDGQKVKDGNILAAEYRSSSETYRAYRHVNDTKTSYYDSTGQSLQKRFLRNPIKARITSKFDLKRKHPILHTIRAHKGVDYGARTGTPILSAGDGRVIFAGVKGGYGKTIEIQHGKRYTTLYAHLNKFPEKLKKGARVLQGDVIGYVGSTGLATGPHLHYEFRVDGKHHDPQKVKLPGSRPLVDTELVAFKDAIRTLDAQFASLKRERESDTLAMR